MNHFLRHLAQRSLAPSPVGIQPRLISRFDTGRKAVRFVEESQETTASSYRTERSAPPAERTSIPQAPRSNEPLPTARDSTDAAPRSTSKPAEAPARSQTEQRVEAALATQPLQARTEAGSAPRLEKTEVPAERIHTVTKLVTDRLRESTREVRVESRAEIVKLSTITAERQSTVPGNCSTPNIRPRSEPSALAPRAEPKLQLMEQPSTAAIQVTIGQIEIRAIHAAVPARKNPATPERGPSLSLDAYLKQRSGA